jgi:glycosyltransferase involved in cell wall biosynthesis
MCLSSISRQLSPELSHDIEVFVSDNCSTDSTCSVVEKYHSFGIRYNRHDTNIGPDRNFLSCLHAAEGQYIYILGDDDLLSDGSLRKILTVLKSGDYGVVSMYTIGYPDVRNVSTSFPSRGYKIYSDSKSFVDRVNILFTFISANIINTRYLDIDYDLDFFLRSNLVQLGWTISAAIKAEKNVYIEDVMVVSTVDNSGGYGVCRVFGRNFHQILRFFITRYGLEDSYFSAVGSRLCFNYFPVRIYKAKYKKAGKQYDRENYFKELFPLFKKVPCFWVFTVPMIVFPYPLAFLFKKGIVILSRLRRFIISSGRRIRF